MGRVKTTEERQRKIMAKKGKLKQDRLFVKGDPKPQTVEFSNIEATGEIRTVTVPHKLEETK